MAKITGSEKQQAILRSAQVLFAELGYEGASFDKISGYAGVAFGLIRHYYKNKSNLYAVAVMDAMNDAHQYIVEKTVDARSGLDALLKGVSSYIEFVNSATSKGKLLLSANPEKVADSENRKAVVNGFDEAIVSLFSEFISRGIDDHSIRNIDPKHNALAVLGLLHGASQVSELAGSALSTEVIMDFITSSLMNGNKGSKEPD